jgi:hypothetical protein
MLQVDRGREHHRAFRLVVRPLWDLGLLVEVLVFFMVEVLVAVMVQQV